MPLSFRAVPGATLRALGCVLLLLCLIGATQAQSVFRDGFEDAEDASLADPPHVVVLRDDRVATLELDYDAENPAFQFWEMSGDPADDAGFLVRWWPDDANEPADGKARLIEGNDGSACLDPDHFAAAP